MATVAPAMAGTTVQRTYAASQPAEWLPARLVLVCEPAIETLFGLLDTDAASIAQPFSLTGAVREHRHFRHRLEAAGATVIDVREALAAGDPEVLRQAARQALVYEFDPAVPGSDRASLAALHDRTIAALDPPALVDIVMLRPVVHIRPNHRALDSTSRFRASFSVDPANNAYFLRDPLVTTAAGVAVGRLRLDVRRPENDIAALALRQLRIEPLLRITAPGFLEGGDVLPAGNLVFQGQGWHSDADGIGQMLDAGAYGDTEVAVVRDPGAAPDDADGHLDSYFAVYGPSLAGICEDRLGAREPEVDVWRPEQTRHGLLYRRSATVGLFRYLADRGYDVVTLPAADRDVAATNGLLVGPGRYLPVRSVDDGLRDRLWAAGLTVEELDFPELTGGHGGPHCYTQVLLRGLNSTAPGPRVPG